MNIAGGAKKLLVSFLCLLLAFLLLAASLPVKAAGEGGSDAPAAESSRERAAETREQIQISKGEPWGSPLRT